MYIEHIAVPPLTFFNHFFYFISIENKNNLKQKIKNIYFFKNLISCLLLFTSFLFYLYSVPTNVTLKIQNTKTKTFCKISLQTLQKFKTNQTKTIQNRQILDFEKKCKYILQIPNTFFTFFPFYYNYYFYTFCLISFCLWKKLNKNYIYEEKCIKTNNGYTYKLADRLHKQLKLNKWHFL